MRCVVFVRSNRDCVILGSFFKRWTYPPMCIMCTPMHSPQVFFFLTFLFDPVVFWLMKPKLQHYLHLSHYRLLAHTSTTSQHHISSNYYIPHNHTNNNHHLDIQKPPTFLQQQSSPQAQHTKTPPSATFTSVPIISQHCVSSVHLITLTAFVTINSSSCITTESDLSQRTTPQPSKKK